MNRFTFEKEEVEKAIKFIQNGQLPDYEGSRLYRFKQKYQDCKVVDGNLFKEDKEIITSDKINDVLTKLYYDAATTVNGRDRLYQKVSEKYIGISRRKVQEFLRNQESYQLHLKPIKVKLVNPIVSYKLYNIFQADLIELSEFKHWNNGYEYILVVIDVYSKFLWAEPLKNKGAVTVSKAFEKIIESRSCKTLQTDRGSEFINDTFKKLLEDYDITHVPSAPYNPKSQAVAERANQTLKRLIYSHMTQFSTKRWVDVLPTLVNNYNNTYHNSTKHKPIELINGDIDISKKIREDAKQRVRKASEKLSWLKDINVGDSVRLRSDTNPNVRKNRLFNKQYKALWSKEIYEVESVAHSSSGGLEKYKLKGLPQLFSRDRLQKIDPDKLQKAEKRPEYSTELPNIEESFKQIRIQKTFHKEPEQTLVQGRSRRGGEKVIDRITQKDVRNGVTLYKTYFVGYPKAEWLPFEKVKDSQAYKEFLK
jgi:transposase InsO family protein